MWFELKCRVNEEKTELDSDGVTFTFEKEFIHESNLDKLKAEFRMTFTNGYDIESIRPFDQNLYLKSTRDGEYVLLVDEDFSIYRDSLVAEHSDCFDFSTEQRVEMFVLVHSHFNQTA